jgi:hypothetical protein
MGNNDAAKELDPHIKGLAELLAKIAFREASKANDTRQDAPENESEQDA